MKLVLISDTHEQHDRAMVPPGDILVHAGDLTTWGDLDSLRAFNAWIGKLPHRHKFIIAGNHDFCFERQPEDALQILTEAQYLHDEGVAVDGITIYGSPWRPERVYVVQNRRVVLHWPFSLPEGEALQAAWDRIPERVDLLITHCPPYGWGDRRADGQHRGCRDLRRAVEEKRPRVHVFGHIHEAYGIYRGEHTTFVNASFLDGGNPPVVLDLDPLR